jgi:hypothetical protein
MNAHYSSAEVERIASEAARLAIALAKPATPEPSPPSKPEPEPETVDTAEAARRMRKTRKTIREYLRLAPQGTFAWKYGRDWSIDYRSFEAWVRGGGPRLAVQALGSAQGYSLVSQHGGLQ